MSKSRAVGRKKEEEKERGEQAERSSINSGFSHVLLEGTLGTSP